MSKGIFGGMFDFDGNGDLGPMEQAAEFCFLDHIVREEELERAGLSAKMLRRMSPSERSRVLRKNGFDPDDFEF